MESQAPRVLRVVGIEPAPPILHGAATQRPKLELDGQRYEAVPDADDMTVGVCIGLHLADYYEEDVAEERDGISFFQCIAVQITGELADDRDGADVTICIKTKGEAIVAGGHVYWRAHLSDWRRAGTFLLLEYDVDVTSVVLP